MAVKIGAEEIGSQAMIVRQDAMKMTCAHPTQVMMAHLMSVQVVVLMWIDAMTIVMIIVLQMSKTQMNVPMENRQKMFVLADCHQKMSAIGTRLTPMNVIRMSAEAIRADANLFGKTIVLCLTNVMLIAVKTLLNSKG